MTAAPSLTHTRAGNPRCGPRVEARARAGIVDAFPRPNRREPGCGRQTLRRLFAHAKQVNNTRNRTRNKVSVMVRIVGCPKTQKNTKKIRNRSAPSVPRFPILPGCDTLPAPVTSEAGLAISCARCRRHPQRAACAEQAIDPPSSPLDPRNKKSEKKRLRLAWSGRHPESPHLRFNRIPLGFTASFVNSRFFFFSIFFPHYLYYNKSTLRSDERSLHQRRGTLNMLVH